MEPKKEDPKPTLPQLVESRERVLADMQKAKNLLAYIEEQISKELDLVKLFEDADKSYGDITTTISGFKVKAEIRKTVKWDSEKLLEAARRLPWADASNIFNIEFSMAEKKYADLAVKSSTDPASKDLIDQINDARTLHFSTPKLKSIEPVGE